MSQGSTGGFLFVWPLGQGRGKKISSVLRMTQAAI